MRVLHIIDSLVVGGAEMLVKDLAPKIRAKGIDFEILVLRLTNNPVEITVRESGVPVHSTGIRSMYSPLQIPKISAMMDGYDVVHVQLFPAQLWAAAAHALKRHAPRLVTTEQSSWNGRRKHRWWSRLDSWMYGQYGLVACNSVGTAEGLQKWCPTVIPKLRVVNNGVLLRNFEDAEPADLSAIVKADLPKLVFVARFYAPKDHATLLRAMTRINNAQLVLVGDGELRGEMERLAIRLGIKERVFFLGQRTDIAQVLKACDIYVHSAEAEAFGIAACEAMAAGLPVIASDVPGLAEVVAGAGILFPVGDDQALAREIQSVLASPQRRQQMSEAGRQRAKRYGIDRIVDEYIDLYKSAMQ